MNFCRCPHDNRGLIYRLSGRRLLFFWHCAARAPLGGYCFACLCLPTPPPFPPFHHHHDPVTLPVTLSFVAPRKILSVGALFAGTLFSSRVVVLSVGRQKEDEAGQVKIDGVAVVLVRGREGMTTTGVGSLSRASPSIILVVRRKEYARCCCCFAVCLVCVYIT